MNVWVLLFLLSATNKRRLPLKFWIYDIIGNYILSHPNLMRMPNSLKNIALLVVIQAPELLDDYSRV